MSKRVPRPPLARKSQLLLKPLPDELLVYDLAHDKAHCLNESAAAIWNLCDGRTSIEQIKQKLEKKSGKRLPESFVWMGLEQLERDQLLEERLDRQEEPSRMSRREAVKRIGVGVALAVPVIYSITAPTASQVSSCRGRGAACTSNAECCSGRCRGNGQCR